MNIKIIKDNAAIPSIEFRIFIIFLLIIPDKNIPAVNPVTKPNNRYQNITAPPTNASGLSKLSLPIKAPKAAQSMARNIVNKILFTLFGIIFFHLVVSFFCLLIPLRDYCFEKYLFIICYFFHVKSDILLCFFFCGNIGILYGQFYI